MRAGQFDRLITIQAKTETQSPSGEPIEEWVNIDDRRPARMLPLKGDERYGSPQEVATDQVEFQVRYSETVAGMTPLHRIIFPALSEDEEPDDAPTRTVYDVMCVMEIGRRRALRILAIRNPDAIE